VPTWRGLLQAVWKLETERVSSARRFVMNEATTDLMAKAFAVFVSALVVVVSFAMTLAFGYALLTDPSKLTEAWVWVRSLPLMVQLLMWALLLPWMLALWVWSLPLAVWLRVAIVVAIVLFADFLVFPRRG
jgi:hypothetical protein